MTRFAAWVLLASAGLTGGVCETSRQRHEVQALAKLTLPPSVFTTDRPGSEGTMRSLFFEGLPYQGKPTRVFAWLGLPKEAMGKVPGVVLLHGGGGTAYKEWVRRWNEAGFAAIAIALEGQTDERIPDGTNEAPWRRHAEGGPARQGIYADSAEPLTDQWMFHAVANAVLANSLLRSLPEVDPTRVGVCGISWGGIVTSTVVGIDSRFAFGIPIYGCGALARISNQYGRALQDNPLYREVWEPLLYLPRATLPMLWLSGPRDRHFPVEAQQTSYRATNGLRMVSLPFELAHGHAAAWQAPDSYAFARTVVNTGQPWARQVSQEHRNGYARAEFAAARSVSGAKLVFKRNDVWEQADARLEISVHGVAASAWVPKGVSAYFFNLDSDGLTLSSDLQILAPARPVSDLDLTGFSWDRVPLNIHFGRRSRVDLSDDELDFLAQNSRFIVLEKGHGAEVHGSTEAGIANTARRLKQRDPDVKVLFYLNAFINWPGYEAFVSYRPEWTLRTERGDVVKHARSGTPRPDPSNPEFREWWSEVVADAHRAAPLDGLFVDALPQALSPELRRAVGDEKARAVVQGMREMIALTKRKLGPERVVLANGLRTVDFREVLDWEGIDGVMIEHFGAFGTASPEAMKTDLESIEIAAEKGKFVVLKGWPGFTWLDADMMAKPYADLLALARERITFPLACFLVAARPGSFFCYSWGYTDRHGMLDPYPEFTRPLGPPKADAVWEGLTATREFEHARVSVDLTARQARIDWH